MAAEKKFDLNHINASTHISNRGYCSQLEICQQIVNNELSITKKYIDPKKDKCFCVSCRQNRNRQKGIKKYMVYQRGCGIYVIPEGWTRICLLVDKQLKHEKINKILANWHPSYHGTTKENVEKIINGDLKFLIPGDTKMDGSKHGIRTDCGRIRKKFTRYNRYYKKYEEFDPNCIFTSPTIEYAAKYAPYYYCKHPNDSKTRLRVQFVFTLRQKPATFKIGQETMGYDDEQISKYVSNDEIEYYTKNNSPQSFLVNGLLIKYSKE